jgi:hypothetical protein
MLLFYALVNSSIYAHITPFFRFVNKRAIYLGGKIILAHAWNTSLRQVIKSQHNIINTVVNVLNIYIY